jgi:hypothetical protein
VFSKFEICKGVAEGRTYFLSLLLYFMTRIHSQHPVVCLQTALPNGKPSSSVNTTVIMHSNSKDKTAYIDHYAGSRPGQEISKHLLVLYLTML